MSAQGSLNWPNGVRQLALVRIPYVEPTEVMFENTVTAETYSRVVANIANAYIEFDRGIDRVTAYGYSFDLDPEKRASLLVIDSTGEETIVRHYTAEDLWATGSNHFHNASTYPIRVRVPAGGTVVLTLDPGEDGWVENIAGLDVPPKDDLSKWAAGQIDAFSYEIEYLDGTWTLMSDSSEYGRTWRLLFWIFFDTVGSFPVDYTAESFEFILATSFAVFRWQYFEPALG
jgi:hypothetical protein